MKYIFIYGILFSRTAPAFFLTNSTVDPNFQNTLTLRIFNFERYHKNNTSPDTHCLIQGLIYCGDWSSKLNDVQPHLNPSIQYAYCLKA